ncbi:hypothetical protein [Streptomyces chattanoogensis]|uniref:hypothetical protein n=1 Tax=Streptomyces chattanoogensis TaxID=66876 RepID=UPI0036B11153
MTNRTAEPPRQAIDTQVWVVDDVTFPKCGAPAGNNINGPRRQGRRGDRAETLAQWQQWQQCNLRHAVEHGGSRPQ